MTASAPAPASPSRARGAPLVVTAQLPPEIMKWADALRSAHFPPARNKLRAHVTLFHALPPSVEPELRSLLGQITKAPAPFARVTGLMKLGGGTAVAIESDDMLQFRAIVADGMHGLLTPQDQHQPRLHITIQNKVSSDQARALQRALSPVLDHHAFRFIGFGLYRYEGGPWHHIRNFAFRGEPRTKVR